MAIGTSVRAAMLPPLLLLMGLSVAPDQTVWLLSLSLVSNAAVEFLTCL